MSRTRHRISRLTDAEKEMMGPWGDEWIKKGLRTGTADWDKWEAAARKCYAFSGIPWPGVVVRVPNPMVGAFAASLCVKIFSSGEAVGEAVDGAVHGAVGEAVREAVGEAVDGAVREAVDE